jgi:hypothetical protein
MTPKPRLEPGEVAVEGPCLRITNLSDDPDVVLYFKSDETAKSAGQSIRNYLEIVDVERTDDAVMHMLQLVLGHPKER